ncbi:MAG TPA: winged helix DNA-binding domain-containing protein [Candidatus Saccharimonadales bacterium]|nr:winged helix DNA-binding domain-containing protein [Candidatus Saccharimonadales bacterium]
MNHSEIARYSLAAQHITQPDFTSAEEVVRYMGAMQAQDYPGALWSVALRTPTLTRKDVEAAIENRSIVRSWPMRGTLHFVAAADIRWITQLLAPRVLQSAAGRERQLDLNEEAFKKARDVIVKALADVPQLERSELLLALEHAGIATENQRGYHILWRFAQEGLICFGSHVGKQPSFALLDTWIPSHDPLPDRATALRELAIRYFVSHGPATLKDFAGWGSMTLTNAKQAIEYAGTEIAQSLIDGELYWHAPSLREPASHSTLLLPGFDEFLLGYKDRSAMLEPDGLQRIVPGGNGMFRPTIVVDGHVDGTWKKTPKAKEIILTLEPFVLLPAHVIKDIEQVARRYSIFLEIPVKLK